MGQLSASRRRDGPEVQAVLAGIADVEESASLDGFLQDLHREVVAESIVSVTVDVRGLEFMSAACLKCFVRWITRVQELERPYPIRFRPHANLPWQRRSLEALRCFATEIVTVQWS